MSLLRVLSPLLLILLGACASRPVNPPITQTDPRAGYRLETRQAEVKNKDNLVILAFSGGGTRAAAFSDGALEFLRRTEIEGAGGKRVRLLDEVDAITGVSGGSFTALAYGLYGERLFAEYEQRFLNGRPGRAHCPLPESIQLGPPVVDRLGSLRTRGRAVRRNPVPPCDLWRYADKGPLILVSATDISTGSRFSFNQSISTSSARTSTRRRCPAPRSPPRPCRSCSPPSRSTITRHKQRDHALVGEAVTPQGQSATAAARAIARSRRAGLWRQRAPALSPPRRWRCL